MRSIHCAECEQHMGDIRDARLKKGLVYLCSECYEDLLNKHSNSQSSNTIHIKGNSEEDIGEAIRSQFFKNL